MPETHRLYRVVKDGKPLPTRNNGGYGKKPRTYDKQSTAQAIATSFGGRVQYADVTWKELDE